MTRQPFLGDSCQPAQIAQRSEDMGVAKARVDTLTLLVLAGTFIGGSGEAAAAHDFQEGAGSIDIHRYLGSTVYRKKRAAAQTAGREILGSVRKIRAGRLGAMTG
ncbi:hypothetical protein [Azorhizophilus paspali]|uniref:Uncharacterized protein n=1 Tax=Azorhizophilus paspali TaxID=69963 RepID=A0ABV6SPR5_AZOPA